MNQQPHIRHHWFDTLPIPQAPLLILHPNFAQQHVVVARFLHAKNILTICVTLSGQQLVYRHVREMLRVAIAEQSGLQVAATPARPVQTDAQMLVQTLGQHGPFRLIIDAFDVVDSDDDDLLAWLAALVEALPSSCQLVLAGRLYTPKLAAALAPQHVALYPVDPNRLLIDYTQPPRQRILLEVYASGLGKAIINGQPINNWDGVLPRQLFFFFIDKGMVTRDEIFNLFWKKLTVREATNVFHVTKRKISELLGFDLTVYQSGYYQISPDIDLYYDVAHFRQLLQNAEVTDDQEAESLLETALQIHRGSFLAAFEGDWLEQRREDLRSLRAESLLFAAQRRQRLGQTAWAINAYLQALALQPQREDVARALMALYAEQGQSNQTASIYANLRQALGESKATPSTETMQLARALGLVRRGRQAGS
jgi:DNA-binding SARP family transcriptional activator